MNNKFYIGRTDNLHRRWMTHKQLLNGNRHHSDHLQNAWNKYGKDSFEFIKIIAINSGNDANDLILAQKIEQYYIDKYIKLNNIMYNKSYSSITGVRLGKEHPFYGKKPVDWMGDGWNKAMETMKGNTGAKNPFYGHHHTEETKAILRKECANFGEKNGFYGKHHSEETRKLLSKRQIERFKNSGTCKKAIINGVEYYSVPEASRKLNISESALRGRVVSKSEKWKNYYYK